MIVTTGVSIDRDPTLPASQGSGVSVEDVSFREPSFNESCITTSMFKPIASRLNVWRPYRTQYSTTSLQILKTAQVDICGSTSLS